MDLSIHLNTECKTGIGIYNTFQKFWGSNNFYILKSSILCSPRLHLFDANSEKNMQKIIS